MNILRGFKAMAAFVLVAALFAGCSEDQTSLNINSVPGRAKIIGSLAYSEGNVLDNGAFKELIKPAANKEVAIEIPNSAFNASAAGVTTFTVTTNAEGKYEIEIPVVNNTTVTIKPADFTGNFYGFNIANNEVVADTMLVAYGSEGDTQRLNPGEIRFSDINYAWVDYQDLQKGFNQTVALRGTIGMGKYMYTRGTTTDPAEITPYFEGAPNASILVGIQYPDDIIDEIRWFPLTTTSNGTFNLNIPVRDIQCRLECEVYALPFSVTNFNYYESYYTATNDLDYRLQPLSGIYEQTTTPDFTEPITLAYSVKNEINEVKLKSLHFTTPYGATDYQYNSYEWNNAEWFDEIFNK